MEGTSNLSPISIVEIDVPIESEHLPSIGSRIDK